MNIQSFFICMDQNFISCDYSMTQGFQMVTRKLVELGALDMEMKGLNKIRANLSINRSIKGHY